MNTKTRIEKIKQSLDNATNDRSSWTNDDHLRFLTHEVINLVSSVNKPADTDADEDEGLWF